MLFEPVTAENFQEWKHHPVTKKLMKMLLADRESMKEGLVNDAYRCGRFGDAVDPYIVAVHFGGLAGAGAG